MEGRELRESPSTSSPRYSIATWKMVDTAAPHGSRHGFYKTISATLYLLDFGSNIFVVIHWYKRNNIDDSGEYTYKHENWGPPPIYQLMIALMVAGHFSCFIFFLLEGLRVEERPVQRRRCMRRALGWYFLPVAQVLRAVQGLMCRRDSRQTAKDEARAEALYAIASATTDGGPLFLLQYFALTLSSPTFSKAGYHWTPGRWLLLSLCLSAFSAAWHVTRAVIFLLPPRSIFLKVAAGTFTLSALMVRCTSFVSIIQLQLVLNASKFFVILGTYILLVSAVPFIGYWFLCREGTSEVNCSSLSKSALRAAGFTYVSISSGPLFPFASVAETCTTMGVSTTRFQARFCFYATCRWILEASLMSTLLIKKWSLCDHNHFHDHSDSLYQEGYLIETMMSCQLYISFLAIGLPLAILSQVLFQKIVQTEAVDTSQNDRPEKESKLAATCAYETGRIAMKLFDWLGCSPV